jgi:hypothetical protein
MDIDRYVGVIEHCRALVDARANAVVIPPRQHHSCSVGAQIGRQIGRDIEIEQSLGIAGGGLGADGVARLHGSAVKDLMVDEGRVAAVAPVVARIDTNDLPGERL